LLERKQALVISTFESSGEKQMKTDLFLLNKTITDKKISFTLRFYLWQGDWISIGYHQKNIPHEWENLSKDGIIKIVRRPSGGGAVLHSGGITYSLTFQKTDYKKYSYQFVNNWLIKSFSQLGLELKNGTEKKSSIAKNCFSSSLFSDLIDLKGFKRIGSAQYWRKGSFLQHGEIQLNPNNYLWQRIFGENGPPPTQIKLNRKDIITYLTDSFLKHHSGPGIENIFVDHNNLHDYF